MAQSFLADKDICIVAYGETKIERRGGRSAYEIAAEVAEQLYKKTKLGPSDIDGEVISKGRCRDNSRDVG